METVFALGSNGSGQLGIGHREDVSVPKPALVLLDGPSLGVSRGKQEEVEAAPAQMSSPVATIAAGGNHTLLLTRAGELYAAGGPATGACGLGSSSSAALPILHRVPLRRDGDGGSSGGTGPSPDARLVAALWETSVVVCPDGGGRRTRVYTFGCGAKGELGQGPLIVRVPRPDLIPNFPPLGTEVVGLSACMGHAVAVLSNGEAYGWGQGRKGQLGPPEDVVVAQPRRIEGVGFRVARAACGKDFTVLVGGRSAGEISILGADKWGLKTSAPSSVPGWKDVQASWGGVYVLQDDGSVLGWGRNDHGQLPPAGLPKLSQIAVGSEHVVGLTESHDAAVAWGWGEHGNCGPQVKQPGMEGEPWNVIASSKYIPPNARITSVAAGCATSFVMIEQASS